MKDGAKSEPPFTSPNIGRYYGLAIVSNADYYDAIIRAYRLSPLGSPVLYKVAKYENFPHYTKCLERTYLNGIEYSKNTPLWNTDGGFTAVSRKGAKSGLTIRYDYDSELNYLGWKLKNYDHLPYLLLDFGRNILSEQDKFELNLKHGTIHYIDVEPDMDLIHDIFPHRLPDRYEIEDMCSGLHDFNMRNLLC